MEEEEEVEEVDREDSEEEAWTWTWTWDTSKDASSITTSRETRLEVGETSPYPCSRASIR